MSRIKRRATVLCLIVLLSAPDSTRCFAREKPGLLIPLGRLIQNGNKVSLSIDAKPFEPGMAGDGCGGDWFRIPFAALRGKGRVVLTIAKTAADTRLREKNIDLERWTSPSTLIDSDDPDVRRTALEITAGCRGRGDKAAKILDYSVNRVGFRPYPGMHYSPASLTLRYGFGICVNHSRLFVALCRAAGVPARTVSGAMVNEKKLYSHHEWVEFYDDAGFWRALEPLFSTDMHFTDLRRIDLIYDIESNPVYPFDRGWERDLVELPNGDRSVFCPDWAVQRETGEMSYTVVKDDFPGSVEISITYELSKYAVR